LISLQNNRYSVWRHTPLGVVRRPPLGYYRFLNLIFKLFEILLFF
jgi:hypothetical protein